MRAPVTEPVVRTVALRDVPPNRRRGGDIRLLLGPKTVGSTSGFFGVLRLEPGERVSEHYHPYSEEFLYVVSGRIRARLGGADGETLDVAPEEGLMVPIGVSHLVSCPGPDPAVVTFHLGPLAPRPELGHVDVEPVPAPGPVLDVGGPR
jgi:putative monooxygenase